MSYWLYPLVAYLVLSLLSTLIPASDPAYNYFFWKLLIGQIYAVPLLVIAFIVSFLLYRRAKLR
ncbi:DUF4017 family protein [Sporolactobacillus nakayamae]|uniref:Uncharacterized protein n=1 Tax=Sporolactobacillus nakayamae TaxID=269670 RepID=A0A1I2QKB7_9BACL|nr:DUF4017 family protein [Sporolactobacillus nakayamae]SFG29045.1 Protein of unknown function [Sporolactobacillus nakayamae]